MFLRGRGRPSLETCEEFDANTGRGLGRTRPSVGDTAPDLVNTSLTQVDSAQLRASPAPSPVRTGPNRHKFDQRHARELPAQEWSTPARIWPNAPSFGRTHLGFSRNQSEASQNPEFLRTGLGLTETAPDVAGISAQLAEPAQRWSKSIEASPDQVNTNMDSFDTGPSWSRLAPIVADTKPARAESTPALVWLA